MTQVSQIFGLDNGPGDLQLEAISEEEDSDDENRDDEIKKLLEEGLSNETFDYDSDTSYQNASKFSNHNNCSFISNKEVSVSESLGRGDVDGDGGLGSREQSLVEDGDNEGIFETPKLVGGTNRVQFKRVDYSSIPNTIPENDSERLSSFINGNRGTYVSNGLGNGNGIHVNGNGNLDGTRVRFMPYSSTPLEKNNNVTERNQKNCEMEEIVVPNPTISLLHKDHCPQSCNEGISDGLLLSADNDVEQLKTMCEFRERQVQRVEESVTALQKDKRALNHHIALMKTEMVQIKSQYEEAEKFAQLKEEHVAYLKIKLQEAIEEFEKARRNEAATHDHCGRLQLEIDKLRQEVKLLSSLGASTQQTEINDVVRQMREKHAQDITAWRKVVNELEGQISVYKRTQHLLQEESLIITKESAQTQTEYLFEEEIERRERELAAQEFQEEFGGIGEAFLNELKNLPEPEILKRVRQEWKTERDKIVNHFQPEIKIYQRKLATLPNELYQMWQQQADELGLNRPPVIKPISRNTATMTEDKYTRTPHLSKSTSLGTSIIEIHERPETVDAATSMPRKHFKDDEVQVNFAAVLASAQETDTVDLSVQGKSSLNSVADEKETSSVIVQTEETLETYKILAALIDNWSREATSCKQRAEVAERKSITAEEELKALNLKFRQLQKVTHTCRKQWKKQEESLRSANSQLKAHYVEIMKKLDDKLAQVDEID